MKIPNCPIAAMLVWVSISLHASDFVVAPADRANEAGSDLLIAGFGAGGADFAVAYTGANFHGPVQITGLAFRLDEGSLNQSFAVVIPQLTLKLSTYSGTFQDFRIGSTGPDAKIVFDGFVDWHTTDQPGSSPNPFDFAVAFSQPFVYDPSIGALVLRYTASTVGGTAAADLDARSDANFGWMAGRSGGAVGLMLVTRFDVTNVPEPTSLALVSLGLMAIFRRESRI